MSYEHADMAHDGGSERHAGAAVSPDEGVVSTIASPPTPRPVLDGDPGEAEIRAAIARGAHRDALVKLDELHGAALYRFVRSLMGTDDRADDLYQTTMIAAYRDLASFEGRSSLRTWLFGIARHRCLDALKAERRHDARFTSSDEVSEVPASVPAPDQLLSDAALVEALARCLAKLAPELRMLLVLRFQEGFGYDDIARITQLRVEALRARVSRAMPVLRRCIEERGAL